jgi:hypothetical protein
MYVHKYAFVYLGFDTISNEVHAMRVSGHPTTIGSNMPRVWVMPHGPGCQVFGTPCEGGGGGGQLVAVATVLLPRFNVMQRCLPLSCW